MVKLKTQSRISENKVTSPTQKVELLGEHPKKSSLVEDRKNFGKTNLEYLVKLYFSFDKVLETQFYIVELSTFRLFSQLNYSISTSVKKTTHDIRIKLLGLSTNNSYYSSSNAAVSFLKFEELFGEFTISVIKQDGTINSAVVTFNIYNKTIEIHSVDAGKNGTDRIFCQFEVDHSQFSFG